ncbi:hypothetical protein [Streptomyces sp. NPDC047046]|uniref:hypothetical protein n=1 Tax=Streptomyces sp. NPDC047046 TaxID=3155378 RepID=UPI0033CF91BA
MDHPLPFSLDGQDQAFSAHVVTGQAAHAALRALDHVSREVTTGQDMNQKLEPDQALAKVLALQDEWSSSPLRRPPAGVPAQEESWDHKATAVIGRIVTDVQAALGDVSSVFAQPGAVLGADGSLTERMEAFRARVQAKQPVVSVSASGCMRRWLATRDVTATSLSIITYIPEHPLYAAAVTPTTALMSDCSGSWRLTLADGWQAMAGEPLIPDPAPDYVLLPRSLEHLAPRIRRQYKEPLFPYDSSAAIVQAVLSGAVPVGVHFTEHVLDSAILPVAIGHGMIGYFRDSGTLIEKPWDASRYMYNAVQGKITFGEGLVIARDLWAARRITSVLAKETQLHEQTHPLDDPLAAFTLEDDDLFSFHPDAAIDQGDHDD